MEHCNGPSTEKQYRAKTVDYSGTLTGRETFLQNILNNNGYPDRFIEIHNHNGGRSTPVYGASMIILPVKLVYKNNHFFKKCITDSDKPEINANFFSVLGMRYLKNNLKYHSVINSDPHAVIFLYRAAVLIHIKNKPTASLTDI